MLTVPVDTGATVISVLVPVACAVMPEPSMVNKPVPTGVIIPVVSWFRPVTVTVIAALVVVGVIPMVPVDWTVLVAVPVLMIRVSMLVVVSAASSVASAAVVVRLIVRLSAVPVPEATKVVAAPRRAATAAVPRFKMLAPVLKVNVVAVPPVTATVFTVVTDAAMRATLMFAEPAAAPAVTTSTV